MLTKQQKELAAIERKIQLEKRTKDAAAASAVAATENSSKAAPAGPSGLRKKATNQLKKLVAQTLKPANGSPAIEQANTTAGPARVAVAVEAAGGHSRRGRALILPQRFKD